VQALKLGLGVRLVNAIIVAIIFFPKVPIQNGKVAGCEEAGCESFGTQASHTEWQSGLRPSKLQHRDSTRAVVSVRIKQRWKTT